MGSTASTRLNPNHSDLSLPPRLFRGTDFPNSTSTFYFKGGEVFYAIYYVTEFKYTGRGDVFKAPKDGYYTFQLWGSPGGDNKVGTNKIGLGGLGGYVQVKLYCHRNQTIYAYVGSAGATNDDQVYPVIPGGYNGGGASARCTASGENSDNHGASGGGATHISYANNPIIADVFIGLVDKSGANMQPYPGYDHVYYHDLSGETKNSTTVSSSLINAMVTKGIIPAGISVSRLYKTDSANNKKWTWGSTKTWMYLAKTARWDKTDQVIAVAGGGGGGGRGHYLENPNGSSYGYAGGSVGAAPYCNPNCGHTDAKTLYNGTNKIAADNSMATGYTHNGSAHGPGRYAFSSAGGGAGWYGGYAADKFDHMVYGFCFMYGGGGTSYIHPTTSTFNIDQSNSFMLSGNNSLLNSTYKKPMTEGVNGYIKVIKN